MNALATMKIFRILHQLALVCLLSDKRARPPCCTCARTPIYVNGVQMASIDAKFILSLVKIGQLNQQLAP